LNHLLDTCVISELSKLPPDARVVDWVRRQEEAGMFLSAVTIGEIRAGIEALAVGKRRDTLSTWLQRDVLERFRGRIIGLDVSVMLRWGVLVGSRREGHRTLPLVDSLIAACALHRGLALATRNERDFAGLGIEVVNPWLGPKNN
jgi:toxin FitB